MIGTSKFVPTKQDKERRTTRYFDIKVGDFVKCGEYSGYVGKVTAIHDDVLEVESIDGTKYAVDRCDIVKVMSGYFDPAEEYVNKIKMV